MDEIAELAGLTKRTVYNNYGGKEALFTAIVAEVVGYAEWFTQGLRAEFTSRGTRATLPAFLAQVGERLALAVVRPEVVALRRLLIGEARAFPTLAADYFRRAPGQVIASLATEFRRLHRAGLLRAPDPRRAASQFAYLVVGAPLDRAVLVGSLPPRGEIVAAAREGVRTFLARYGAGNHLPSRGAAASARRRGGVGQRG